MDIKTSVRLVGEDEVDLFRAVCSMTGERPHELATKLVREGMARLMADPAVGDAVRTLVSTGRAARAAREMERLQVEQRRAAFRVLPGGG